MSFTPPRDPSFQLRESLTIHTNDPDAHQSPLELFLVSEVSDLIDEGDLLDQNFAFLDPTGQNQLENLRGKVLVLAYFALF